jgi:hypothetical protein
MVVGRSHVDAIALDAIAVGRVNSFDGTGFAKQLRQQAWRVRRNVLHDENRGGEICRQTASQF